MIVYFAGLVLLWVLWKFCYRRSKLLEPVGKVILITGCDSGIGRKLAVHFAGQGCIVFAGCLRPAEADGFPSNVRVLDLDITKQDTVSNAIKTVNEYLQQCNTGLWCLINNAGVCTCGEFDWLTMEQCCRLIEINLLGTIRVTKACLPLIRKNHGRVVTVTSVNGFVAYPGLSIYSATKFALEGLNDALRIELESQGVKIVVVEPGDLARLTSIMSGHESEAERMWAAMTEEDRRQYGSYFRQYHESVRRNYGLSSPRRFEDSPILKDLNHAVLGEKPQSRYLSAPLPYRIAYGVLRVLPTGLRDRFLGFVASRVLNR